MHNYQLLDEKMQFVEVVAAETGWVQNMSMLDTQGFEDVFPLDLYDAQASIRNYNALIGFSCETMVLFDTVYVSGGRIGTQIEISPDDLIRVTNGTLTALTRN